MEKVCGFCLIKGSQYEIIENLLKDLLDTLLIPLDFTTLKEPISCKECVKQLHELFNFKTLCLYTEDALIPFLEKNNGEVSQLNLESVYSVNKLLRCTKTGEKPQICRLCLEISTHCLSLDTAILESKVRNVFENYLPEISLQAIESPSICENCVQMLHSFDRFATMCTSNAANIVRKSSNNNLHTRKSKNPQQATEEEEEEDDDEDNDAHQVGDIDLENGVGRESTVVGLEGALEFLSKMCNYSPETKTTHCYKCTYKTVDELDLKAHLESHLPKGRYAGIRGDRGRFYKCPRKNCSFLSRNTIKIIIAHSKTHGKKINCFMCGERCDGIPAYRRHTKLKHKEGGFYKCDVCPFLSKIWRKYERHTASHKDQLLQCRSCPYKTRYKRDLLKHQYIHYHDEVYYCHDCSYSTKVKQRLKMHVLLHMSDSRSVLHKCEKCEFSTKYYSSLQKHCKRKHSDNPLYQCDFCQAKFKCEPNRRMHTIQFHGPNDEVRKKYIRTCPNCDYETFNMGHMKLHMEQVHGIPVEKERFQCSECDFESIYKSSMKIHFKRKHTMGK
ncbi:unnamed protein product [Phaedon cochleariae]|nr:unnamed protein product [Phaedon cochleariae]